MSKFEDLKIENSILNENLTLEMLKNEIWDKNYLNLINNQILAKQIFYLFLNVDLTNAAYIIQHSINVCGADVIRADVTGIMDAKTINAINLIHPQWLSNRIRLEQINFYMKSIDDGQYQRDHFFDLVRVALTM